MVADKIFDLSISSQLVYQSDIPIKGKTFVKVFIDRVGEGTWEVIDGNNYQLINDSLVFTERPTGSLLIMQVATTPSELQQTPTDTSLLLTIKEGIKTLVASLGELVVVSESADKVIVVANNIDAVNTVALNISEVLTVLEDINKVIVVADNISHVNNVDSIMAEVINVSVNKVAVVAVSDNMASIISVKDNLGAINTVSDNIIPLTSIYTDIIPNLTEILQAYTNAQIATTKAGEALASEQKAKKWANEVEDVEVEPYKYSAKHWAEKAKKFAEGLAVNIAYNNTISELTATNTQSAIDELASKKAEDALVVHKTYDETIAGVKTFTSSPIVPTPMVGDNSTKIATTAFVKTEINVLKDVPQNAQTVAYTLSLTDRGKSIDVSTGGITITVPLSSAVNFPIGATVSITNLAATAITIVSSATLRQAGTANTGSRTLAAYGMATLRKVATDTWFISGAGLS